MAQRYHGKKGAVYLSTTASGTASSIQLSEWSLDNSTDKVPVTSFGDTNQVFVQGLPNLSGRFTGFWNDGDNKLFTAAASTDGCKLYLYPTSDAPSKYFY